MKLKLTTAQKEAIETIDHDCRLIAGAGSGKTKVLIERFKKILQTKKTNLENVLAVTFTNQAADEMKRRIREEIKSNPRLKHYDEEFSKSQITTFHSFFTLLLREQGFKANVNPQFNILDAVTARVIIWRIVEKVFANHLKNEASHLWRLLDFGNEYFLKKEFENLFQQVQSQGLNVDEVRNNTLEKEVNLQQEALAVILRIKGIFDKLEDFLSLGHKATKTYEKISWLADKKAEIENGLAIFCLEKENTWNHVTDIDEVLSNITNIKGEAKRPVDLFKKEINLLREIIAEVKVKKLKYFILDLLSEIEAEYLQFKKKNQLLDFEELQINVLILLKNNPEARKYYHKLFSYIMIDEFQDTSKIQKEIIALLRSKDSLKQNLFLVGDSQQSIYGFRGIDLESGEKLAEGLIKGNKSIKLLENFRSEAEILDFVNGIFKGLGVVNYNHLESTNKPSGKGNVEILKLPALGNRLHEIQEEARCVAQIIKEERPKDCVILLQTNTHYQEYVKALVATNISVQVIGGQSFYSSQLVYDLTNFLRVMLNPWDKIALVGVLKGFFAQNDSEIECIIVNKSSTIEIDTIKFYQQRFKLTKFSQLAIDWIRNTGYLNNKGKETSEIWEKWLGKVQRLEKELYFSEEEILYFFQKAEEEEIKEADGKVLEDGTVKIMTIHQAKGLEFSTVFLVDLNRRKPSSSDMAIVTREGVLTLKNKLVEGEWETPFYYQIELANRKEKEAVEWLRLLYVALTRAKKDLYLVGTGDKFNKNKLAIDQSSWWSMFQKLRIDLKTGGLISEKLDPLLNQIEIPENRLKDAKSKELINEINKFFPITVRQNENMLNDRFLVKRDSWSVSALTAYLSCPRKFYFRHIKEIPELYRLAKGFGYFSALDYGKYVHKVLEFLQPNSDINVILEEAAVRFLMPEKTKLMFKDKALKEIKQIMPILKKEMLKGEVYHEVPIKLMVAGNQINGIIDLLIKGKDWAKIIDFKTKVAGKNNDRSVLKYQLQLEIYALAISKLTNLDEIEAGLLILDKGTWQKVEINKEILVNRENWIKDVLESVNSHSEQKFYLPIKDSYCFSCGYEKICKR